MENQVTTNDELKMKFKLLHKQVVDLNLSSVVDELFSDGVIAADDLRGLHHIVDPKTRSQRLMSILHTSPHPQTFIKLRQALHNERAYSWFIDTLDLLSVEESDCRVHDEVPEFPIYVNVSTIIPPPPLPPRLLTTSTIPTINPVRPRRATPSQHVITTTSNRQKSIEDLLQEKCIDSQTDANNKSTHHHVTHSTDTNGCNDLLESATVIIDNGSSMCKAGTGNYDEPSVVFPSVVGRTRANNLSRGVTSRTADSSYVGHKAQLHRETLSLHYPVERGIVTNWSDMERVWNYAFTQMDVDSAQRPVILTETLYDSKNREKMAEVLFETFHVPMMHIIRPATLTMYASCCTTRSLTGVVLDCGDGTTQCTPIYAGFVLPHTIVDHHISGRDVTDRLLTLLTDSVRTTTVDHVTARQIKEKMCYVALDSDLKASVRTLPYTLDTGHVIRLGAERFKSPEMLFNSRRLGDKTSRGVQDMLYDSVDKCDSDIQADMYSNVILSGGSTLFPGFRQRLLREIETLTDPKTRIVIRDTAQHVDWWLTDGGANGTGTMGH